jgi:hypothetical protein
MMEILEVKYEVSRQASHSFRGGIVDTIREKFGLDMLKTKLENVCNGEISLYVTLIFNMPIDVLTSSYAAFLDDYLEFRKENPKLHIDTFFNEVKF